MKSRNFDLVGGAFTWGAGFPADFGVHSLDRKRALDYFGALREDGLGWPDVKIDIELYCEEQCRTDVEKQLTLAKKLWID